MNRRWARDRQQLCPAVALEHDAARDAQKVRQRQRFAYGLRPVGNAAKRKHETRQRHGRQEEKEGELHGLQLIARDGGKK